MIKYRCDSCGQKLGSPEAHAGKRVKCSSCGKPVRVPQAVPSGAESPASASKPKIAAKTRVNALKPKAVTAPEGDPDLPIDLGNHDAASSADQPVELTALDSIEPDSSDPASLRPAWAPPPPPPPEGSKPREPQSQRFCPKCRTVLSPTAVICVQCGHNFKSGSTLRTVVGAPAGGGAMEAVGGTATAVGRGFLGLIVGGIAAVVAGAAWAGIATATGYEIGWVAWGLGAVVGFAVLVGRGDGGATSGLSAAGLAAMGLIVGKLLIFQWAVPAMGATELLKLPEGMRNAAILEMKVTHTLPPELDAKLTSDAPLDAATEAKLAELADAKLAGMPQPEKERIARVLVDAVLPTIPYSERLKDTFSLFDILWFGLALATAFRVASGFQKDG